MFLACFCNHQYSRGKAVAANHVARWLLRHAQGPPTRLLRQEKLPYATPLFHLFCFISCYMCGRHKRTICWTMSSQSALSCHGSASGLLNRTHLWSHVTDWPHTGYGRRAFSVAGPTAWNSFPVEFRDPTISDACFRRHLKTVLFAQQRRHHSV